MKLPTDTIIAREKATNYLLVRQTRSDKAAFLESGGFTALNPDALIAEIRLLKEQNEALPVGDSKFGRYYEVVGVCCMVRSGWI